MSPFSTNNILKLYLNVLLPDWFFNQRGKVLKNKV